VFGEVYIIYVCTNAVVMEMNCTVVAIATLEAEEYVYICRFGTKCI